MSDEQQLPPVLKRGPGRPPNPVSQSAMVTGMNAPSRPEQRSDQRAEQRESVRENVRLQRRFKTNDDKYHIPQAIIDQFKAMGLELEWKRHAIGGRTEDYYHAELAQNYWEPLMIENYPVIAQSLLSLGKKSGPIIKSDQILMVRPDYLCEDARIEQRELSNRLMQANRSKMKEAPSGTFERVVDDRRIGPAIKKTYETIGNNE